MNTDILKAVLGFVTSTSVGAVVKNVVVHTMPYNTGIVTQVTTSIGGFIIASMLADTCTDYVNNKVFGEEKK